MSGDWGLWHGGVLLSGRGVVLWESGRGLLHSKTCRDSGWVGDVGVEVLGWVGRPSLTVESPALRRARRRERL